jgi:transcriptional regulator with XRE-family HTH domain
LSTNKRQKAPAGTELPPAADSATREFSRRLRSARAARGLTLRDVATEAGVSIAYLSDLERGVLANPTLDKLRAIADALRVSIDELLGNHAAQTETEPATTASLREFAETDAFRVEVDAEAKRWRRDPADVREEWMRLLECIQIGGRRPSTANDYLFIFESIRRAIAHR